jgi:hypothetical protein
VNLRSFTRRIIRNAYGLGELREQFSAENRLDGRSRKQAKREPRVPGLTPSGRAHRDAELARREKR